MNTLGAATSMTAALSRAPEPSALSGSPAWRMPTPFSGWLDRRLSAPDTEKAEKTGVPDPRRAAEEFVALSLVQPVLARLRADNQAWGPFAPGAHEKQFGPLIDAEIALRMTRASNFPLVDAVARQLESHARKIEEARHE